VKHLGFQCGYCTPGMIMNAYALLHKTPKPTRAQITRTWTITSCRCGTHGRSSRPWKPRAAAKGGGAMSRDDDGNELVVDGPTVFPSAAAIF